MFVALGLAYAFAAIGSSTGETGIWAPFLALGKRFPVDVALLLGSLWVAGAGLAMLLVQPVGPGGRFAADGRFIPGNQPTFHAAGPFLVNALLLLSALFAAGVGIQRRHAGPEVALLVAVAALQVAGGLILMIMSFFDRPRANGRLAVGTMTYVVSTVAAVALLVLGKPD